MGIIFSPGKRFLDTQERVLDHAMDMIAMGTAIVEPESIGIKEFIETEVYDVVADVTTAYTGTISKHGDLIIAANTSAQFDDEFDIGTVPQTATIDSVVAVDQRFDHLYLSGYIAEVDFGLVVKFVGHNIGSISATISNGGTLRYAVHSGVKQVQATTPNAALTVTPRLRWIDDTTGDSLNRQLTINNLNAAAMPAVGISNGSITEIELKSDDMARVASLYTGRRATLTVSGNKSVPIGAKVLLGTITLDPSTTATMVRPGQVTPGPLLSGYVTSSNGTTSVNIYAHNTFFTTQTVPDGTEIKVIIY